VSIADVKHFAPGDLVKIRGSITGKPYLVTDVWIAEGSELTRGTERHCTIITSQGPVNMWECELLLLEAHEDR
jgi:hypothetical protein